MVRNVKKMREKVRIFFDKKLTDKRLMKDIGGFSAQRIQTETRKGKSLVTGKRLKKIKPITKTLRDILSRYNRVARAFVANKSQLTFSGQLLDSIKFTADATKNQADIFPSGSRRKLQKPLKGLKGKEITNNVDLFKDLRARGFEFLGLDKRAIAQIKKIILRDIRRKLRKGL